MVVLVFEAVAAAALGVAGGAETMAETMSRLKVFQAQQP